MAQNIPKKYIVWSRVEVCDLRRVKAKDNINNRMFLVCYNLGYVEKVSQMEINYPRLVQEDEW